MSLQRWQRASRSVFRGLQSSCGILRDAQDDILAYMAFPYEHWRQIYSTNPPERLNKEIGRRRAKLYRAHELHHRTAKPWSVHETGSTPLLKGILKWRHAPHLANMAWNIIIDQITRRK